MRGKHKHPAEISIESNVAEEPMPDDAVLPVEDFPVAAESPEVSTGNKSEAIPGHDPLAILNQQVEEQKKLAADYRDMALRAQAELENVRKRTSRDIESAHKYALERFVMELLPVMDSMEMGIAASVNVDNSGGLKQGMVLTHKIFATALEKSGVSVIDPQGEKFNPVRHEAVTLQQVEGVEPGMIISVLQKGYELNGRLVRPAMVIVSR